MNQDINVQESPLAVCVRTSGNLPISIQGHYDHWQKYQGRRDTIFEDGIKFHLKNLRVQRSYTQIKKKSHKEKRLPSLRSGTLKKSMSGRSGKGSAIFDRYSDIIDSGSTWWVGSPLPDIGNTDSMNVPPMEIVQQPFYIAPKVEPKATSISKPVRCISDELILYSSPPRTLHIYLASANSDMAIERKYLEGAVWPYLRHLCLQYHRELIIHDLHTFSEELLTRGRNKYLEEINRSLNLCIDQKSNHIKAVILFGDYDEKKGPPESLSRADMHMLKKKMQKDIIDIKRIQEKMQEIRQRQQQMKQNELRRESSIDIFADRDKSDIDLKSGLKLNSGNDTFNSEISALGEEIDILTYKTNISFIEQWYSRTEESPGTYFLQHECDIIKDLKSNDPNKIKQGKLQWTNAKEQLCHIVSSYLPQIMSQQMSIFEHELDLLKDVIKRNNCFLITRTFSNIPKNDRVKSAKSKLVTEIQENQQRRFELSANSDGFLSEKDNWEHASYLKHFSANIQNVLERDLIENIRLTEDSFNKNIKNLRIPALTKDDFVMLISEHEALQDAVNQKTLSAEDLLLEIQNVVSKIENLLETSESEIILLTAPPMTGKSTAMATFIDRFKSRVSKSESIFVYRIIGSSFHCGTKIGLLRSICLQLSFEAGIDIAVPHEFMALKTMFYHMTLLINFKVIICIDGLDLLTDLGTDTTATFEWLPIHSRNISCIISCSINTVTYKSLLSFLQSSESGYKELTISELSDESIELVFRSYLKRERILLSEEQEMSVLKNCFISRTIGFVESNLRIVKSWSATSAAPRLGAKFELNIHTFLSRLEDTYGEPIIRRLLGYITCFKDGCTVNELIDLMTLDDVTQKYLGTALYSKDFRFALSLLRCVLQGFEELLEHYRDRSGLLTIKWKNTLYLKAATDRYLLQKDKAASYHQVVSHYFMNDPIDQALLLQIIDDDAKKPIYSRFLTRQQLLYNEIFDRSINRFNLRKILQLPYHLMQSQNSKLAKLTCFFNFYWLQATVLNFDCYKVIEEITLAYQFEPEDLEYPVLLSTLELCQPIISRDDSQLIGQLLGRITNIVRRDVASVEPQKYPNLELLYKSLRKNDWFTAIVPSQSCMITTENSEFTSLGYHAAEITCILLNAACTIIYSSTNCGQLYSWNVINNKIISIILGVGKNIFQMALGNSNKSLVTAMPEKIEIWDLEGKIVTKSIEMLYDLYCLTVSYDTMVFSAFFYGIFWMASWDLGTGELVVSKTLPGNTLVNCDGELAVATVCRDFHALVAVKSDNKAFLIDIKSGEINPKVLQCKESGSAITHVAMSSKYYVLCGRGLSQKDFVSIISCLDLFDTEKLQFVRRISGCTLDATITLAINSVGSHAITVNSDRDLNISNVSTWNLETEEHKHSSETPFPVEQAQCTDLARIFLLKNNSNVMYKVNTLTAKSKLTEKKRGFSVSKYPLNDIYIFVQCEDNSMMDVYNIMRNKTRGRKVRSFPSLANPTDIILPHKEKCIILSKRGYSPNLPGCKEVFQAIKIYDMSLGRIEKEHINVGIFPSRKSEFCMLDNNILLGLADTRTNPIYWNVDNGRLGDLIRRNKQITPDLSNRRNTVETPFQTTSSADFVIDTILVSGDRSILLAAYSTRFLCVFSLTEKCHKVTLVSDSSTLHLQTAAITYDGRYVVLNNFNETSLRAFLTLWNTQTGHVDNSLPVSNNVLSITITRNSSYVAFIKENIGAFLWNTSKKDRGEVFKIPRSEIVARKTDRSNHRMEFIRKDEVLLIFTNEGFHFWSVFGDHIETIGSFQPDHFIQTYSLCCDESVIAFMLKGSSELYTFKLVGENGWEVPTKSEYLDYFEKDGAAHSDDEEDD